MSVQIQNKIEALQASYVGGVYIDPIKSILTDLNVNPGSALLEYVDNADALANGLQIGNFYRTGDFLKVVH